MGDDALITAVLVLPFRVGNGRVGAARADAAVSRDWWLRQRGRPRRVAAEPAPLRRLLRQVVRRRALLLLRRLLLLRLHGGSGGAAVVAAAAVELLRSGGVEFPRGSGPCPRLLHPGVRCRRRGVGLMINHLGRGLDDVGLLGRDLVGRSDIGVVVEGGRDGVGGSLGGQGARLDGCLAAAGLLGLQVAVGDVAAAVDDGAGIGVRWRCHC